MPWQQHVADVALEIDNETGRLYYREIVLTVPRQSGKTTAILSIAVHRALAKTSAFAPGPQNIVYTAQTRNAARKKWEDGHVPLLRRTPAFRKLFRVRLNNGAEALIWDNGSTHAIASTTEKSGHGETLDLGFVDEAFAQTDSRQEQALKPSMITRNGAQLWVVSTAGTAASVYLRGKVDRGRQAIRDGAPSRVAYFEWSAPDDADPSDREVWRACMPALGYTISEDAIQAEYDSMTPDNFARAYLNQWRDGKAPKRVIAESDWLLCQDELAVIDPASPIALGLAVRPDRAHAALAVAGQHDGLDLVEVTNHRPGTGWLVDRVVEIMGRRQVLAVALDPASPAGSLIPAFEAAGVDLMLVTGREYTQACGALYDQTTQPSDPAEPDSRSFRHHGQVSLDVALAGAMKRASGDAFVWDRRGATDISPLEAVTLARHARISAAPSVYDPLASLF